jgi:hypothetical protein
MINVLGKVVEKMKTHFIFNNFSSRKSHRLLPLNYIYMRSPLYVNLSGIYPYDLIHIQDDYEWAGRIDNYEGTVNHYVLLSVFCRITYKCKCDTTILCLFYRDWWSCLWVGWLSVEWGLCEEWMNNSKLQSKKNFNKDFKWVFNKMTSVFYTEF